MAAPKETCGVFGLARLSPSHSRVPSAREMPLGRAGSLAPEIMVSLSRKWSAWNNVDHASILYPSHEAKYPLPTKISCNFPKKDKATQGLCEMHNHMGSNASNSTMRYPLSRNAQQGLVSLSSYKP